MTDKEDRGTTSFFLIITDDNCIFVKLDDSDSSREMDDIQSHLYLHFNDAITQPDFQASTGVNQSKC